MALLTAVAGLAHPLAQSNVHAADAVLSAVAEALGWRCEDRPRRTL